MRLRGSTTECGKCAGNRNVREWKQRNRERARELNRLSAARPGVKERKAAYNREYQSQNLDKVAAKAARWRAANPERNKEIDAAFRDRHRDRLRIQWGVRRHKKKLLWSSGEDVAVFYESAKRLSECFGVPFEVDHILPLKGRKVSGLHVVENLQVITMVANRRKQNKVFA